MISGWLAFVLCCPISWFTNSILGCDAEGAAHGFAHFWLTDSCASTVKEVRGVEPFEVLSLAGSIAVALHI